MAAAEEKQLSFFQQVGSLPANFWFANFMEILERLAFFGVRAIAPLYLIKEANENGLGLDYAAKGDIYMWWALIQCLVPMVSGGYTERYGYRLSLVIAFSINIVGYLLMANSLAISNSLAAQGWEEPGYWVFLLAACLIGFGTAIFKPPVHGTIAKTTDENTSSLGWGVFYWVVNIGGALAPMLAAQIRGEIDWNYVFYGAAIVTACNFIPLFLLYQEPAKEPPKPGEEQKGIFGTFISSIGTIFADLRLVAFLLIFSCFWLMFMQLWDLLPNFIDEWINTSDVAPAFGWFSQGWVLDNGQTKPEMLININSWSIILFVLLISWLIRKINKVVAMVIGMVISLVGFVGAGMTQMGIICALMIFIFSIGEMTCSPTFSAYVAVIAPRDKKALYMGYSNIPFAIGWAAGNKVGGLLYEGIASKYKLAREYLINKLGFTAEFAKGTRELASGDEIQILPDGRTLQVMEYVRSGDGQPAQLAAEIQQRFEAVDWAGVPKEDISDKLDAIYADVLGKVDQQVIWDATNTLWDLHHPYMVWVYLGIIGLVGTIGMLIFYFATRKAIAEQAAKDAEPAA